MLWLSDFTVSHIMMTGLRAHRVWQFQC